MSLLLWGRAPREPALSEVEGSKPSKARQAPRTSASLSGRLQNRSPHLLHRPLDLFAGNHCRRRNQQMVTRDSVHASLHGIDEQPAPLTSLPHQSSKILLRRKRSLGLLVSDKLDPEQLPQPEDIPNHIHIASWGGFAE